MQYKYVLGYLRLSNDDDDKKDESSSIKNQTQKNTLIKQTNNILSRKDT